MKKSELKELIVECLTEAKLSTTGHEISEHYNSILKAMLEIESALSYIDEIVYTDILDENLEKQYASKLENMAKGFDKFDKVVATFEKTIK